jgi:ribosome-binding protein aMBF1 (putative translation factor)
MIRTETEYREAVNRVVAEEKALADHEAALRAEGLAPDQMKRLMDPIVSFHIQLKEEVQSYERLKRGELDELINFQGLGRLLIAARIARGLSQRELAERLGVNESQVSRDERNEYHGVTVDRASRILDALGVGVRSKAELMNQEPLPV